MNAKSPKIDILSKMQRKSTRRRGIEWSFILLSRIFQKKTFLNSLRNEKLKFLYNFPKIQNVLKLEAERKQILDSSYEKSRKQGVDMESLKKLEELSKDEALSLLAAELDI